MEKNILACRIGSYGPFSLHSYEHLAEIGIKYIERQLASGEAEIEMLKDILEEFDLNVSSFQASFTPLDDKVFEKQIDEIITVSSEFGTKVIFTSLKVPEHPFKAKKLREQTFSQLRYLGDQIKSKNMILCLETHPNLVTNGRIGKATMDEIHHESIKINFDTANMYYYNKNIDAVEELDHIISHVGSVHLKDTNGKYKTWYFPALGEGVVDFPTIVKNLSDVGFHGPYTMELEGIKDEVPTLDLVKNRVFKSVEYLKKIPGF